MLGNLGGIIYFVSNKSYLKFMHEITTTESTKEEKTGEQSNLNFLHVLYY